MGQEKLGHTTAVIGADMTPEASRGTLGRCGNHVEIVDTKYIKLFEKKHNLRLAKGHEIALRDGCECCGISLGKSKQMFRLYETGS